MTRTSSLALWSIAALFAAFNLVTSVVPALLPAGLIGIANTLLLVGFAIVHGSRLYGMMGIAIFLLASFVVGNIFENLSILTGFPFGITITRTFWGRDCSWYRSQFSAPISGPGISAG